MRLAIIGSKGFPAAAGGIERHVEELATRLAKRGFDVTVYGRPWYTGPVPATLKGVHLVQLGSIRTKHLDAITHTFAATLHAMRQGFDVYHFHSVGPALLAWLPRLFRPRAKVVVTFHCLDRRVEKWGFFARMILKFGEWAACRFAHKTIVVSKTLTHYVREVYDIAPAYIPNGVNIPNAPRDRRVLEDLGLDKGRYVINVGRLVRSKNVHHLIAAWAKLKDSATDLRVLGMKLVIVGDGAETDEYVWSLRAQAHARKDIVLAGYRGGMELQALLANAAFGVHPSATEGLPISVLEKMAHGKAVLVSDIPEHLEVVEGRGYSFKLGNIRDLTLQLYWMMTHPKECAATGKIAKKHVAAFYNWDEIAKETAAVYKSLAPAPKRVRKTTRKATLHAAPARRTAAG